MDYQWNAMLPLKQGVSATFQKKILLVLRFITKNVETSLN
jgi:hypothetical protein